MRLRPVVMCAVLLCSLVETNTLLAAKKAPPPAADIAAVPAQETNTKEKVTVAADPFDTRQKADFFRNDYVGHSILPVRLYIRNDSDTPLDLSDVRIQFIASDGTKLPAATPDELNRRLFRFKDLQPRHIPGTPITYHSTPVDKKIQDDDKDFSFTQTTIAPHSTASGFLFYDTHDLDEPVMRGAEIYLKQAHFADPAHTELFAFSVPLDKYLAAEKAAKQAADAKDSSDAAAKSGGSGDTAKDKSQ